MTQETDTETIAHDQKVLEESPSPAVGTELRAAMSEAAVAFARAILSVPRLLLLDEPMSSLDSRLKKRLIPFLLRIRDEFRIPLIYVTHDAGELLALCDEVLVLERGRLIARGSPADVLEDSLE